MIKAQILSHTGFVVQESSLAGAGLGLWTLSKIQKNTNILFVGEWQDHRPEGCKYSIYNEKKKKYLVPNTQLPHYSFFANSGYVNKNGKMCKKYPHNATLLLHNNSFMLRTTKTILPNTEIIADYVW